MRIAIDVDEVLGKQIDTFIHYLESRTGQKLKHEHFKSQEWTDYIDAPFDIAKKLVYDYLQSGILHNMETTDGSKKALESLKKHELYIITGRQTYLRYITESWLNKHFPNTFKHIFVCNNPYDNKFTKTPYIPKWKICKNNKIEYLIEDDSIVSTHAAENGIKVILLNKPWNQKVKHKNITRVNHWDEIPKILNK